VHASRSSTGTLTLSATVRARRGRAPRGGLLGVLTVRAGAKKLTVAVSGRGAALADLPAIARSATVAVSYSGNALYTPCSAHTRA